MTIIVLGFTDSAIKVQVDKLDIRPRPPGDGPVGPDNPPDQEHIQFGYGNGKKKFLMKFIDRSHYEPHKEDYINLYNKEFDLRHCWSFGVYQRNFNEVVLEKDLYKATIVVNGKKEVYQYSGKLPNEDDG